MFNKVLNTSMTPHLSWCHYESENTSEKEMYDYKGLPQEPISIEICCWFWLVAA